MNTTALDSYESICDFAREKSENLDDLRWTLGDCANVVMLKYSDKSVEDFSRDIGQHKSTIYQYAKVANCYPVSLRRRLRADMPNINYSHMRDAMRLPDDDIMAWLEEVSSNDWSADNAAHELTKKLGHKTVDSVDGFIIGFNRYDGKHIIEINVGAKEFNQLKDIERVTIRAR